MALLREMSVVSGGRDDDSGNGSCDTAVFWTSDGADEVPLSWIGLLRLGSTKTGWKAAWPLGVTAGR